jgi:hypothetical protein
VVIVAIVEKKAKLSRSARIYEETAVTDLKHDELMTREIL